MFLGLLLFLPIILASAAEWEGDDRVCESNRGSCTRVECCPHGLYAEDVCTGWPDRACCLHPPDCDWKTTMEELSSWPEGDFALPQSTFDCPVNDKFSWIRSFTSEVLTISGYDVTVVDHVTPSPVRVNGEDDVTIGLCCRSDSDPSVPTDFPTPHPFLLIQFGDKCQEVKYMTLEVESTTILGHVTSSNNSTFRRDTPGGATIGLCYYQVYDSCYHPIDGGRTYRGIINFGREGTCRQWASTPQWLWLWFMKYVIEENYCTGIQSYRPFPYCTMGDKLQDCTVPKCPDNRGDLEELGPGYPVRQKVGNIQDARLAIDSSILTCTRQDDNAKPWWQIDLQRVEEVVAIEVHDNYGKRTCPWWLANVYVGMTSEDFHQGEALMCIRNHTISDTILWLECRQPVKGQYITIQQHVYLQYDDEKDKVPTCLNLCNVRVFVKPHACGSPFESGDITVADQLTVSSSAPEVGPSGLALYSVPGWCAQSTDANPYIDLDLLETRQMTGLVVQGGDGIEKDEMVTRFTLWYGLQSANMLPYTENSQDTKEFVLRELPHDTQQVVLLRPFWARYVRLRLLQWIGRPCFRFRLNGCLRTQANLVKDGTIKVSSTPHFSAPAFVLGDGRLDTCWTSGRTQSPWILVTFNDRYYIHDVLLRQNWLQPGPALCLLENERGHSYLGTINTTTSGKRCQHWDTQSPQSHQMSGVNMPEGIIGEAENFCRNPFLEAKPWCYTLDPATVYEVCPIPMCADLSGNMKVYISGDAPSSTTDLSSLVDGSSVCGDVRYRLDQRVVGTRCTSPIPGRALLLTFPAMALITLCEVQVFGFSKPNVRSDRQRKVLSCDEGRAILPVAMEANMSMSGSGDEPWRVISDKETHGLLASVCEVDACYMTETGGTGVSTEGYWMEFGCVPYKLAESRQEFSVVGEGVIVDIGDYLNVYDTRSTWTWRVTAKPGYYAECTVDLFILSPADKITQEALFVIDPGDCRDTLTVSYMMAGEGEGRSTMMVEGKQTFISPSSTMDITLNTCYKTYPERDSQLALSVIYRQSDCFGCNVLDKCASLSECSQECGVILSPSFPLDYAPNQKCAWQITVNRNAFIQLSFTTFDVFEEVTDACNRDLVEVTDSDRLGNEISMGKYCNTYLPPDVLYSSWNRLKINLLTDGQNSRKGFRARYEAVYQEYGGTLPTNDTTSDCKEGWSRLGINCMKVIISDVALSWQNAEAGCREEGARLVSIKSESEMSLINFMLVDQYGSEDVYIGLNDRGEEGVFVWMDGTPLSYSNWQPGEPNGGDFEDCSVINLRSIRFKSSWKDIPCASRDVRGYICEYEPSDMSRDLSLEIPISHTQCLGDMYTCGDGTCILNLRMCDGFVDCKDGGDEDEHLCGTTCPSYSFFCEDGSCISMSFVCDGKMDCSENEDETECIFRNCTAEEFQCSSGPCVTMEKRCDLLQDCYDNSDEMDCTSCSEQTSFQCYEGSCIPAEQVCDNMADCPGLGQEDEDPEQCLQDSAISCKDWRMKGFTESGRYLVRYKNEEPVDVECDMTSHPDQVVTIVHHNSEANTSVHGFEPPASYRRNLTYFASFQHMIAIRDSSVRCEMFMEIVCFNAEAINPPTFWADVNDRVQYYNYDVPPPNSTCRCRLQKACHDGGKRCHCTRPPDNLVTIDRGYFLDTELLPPRMMTLHDTGSVYEKLNYVLGPFRCYQAYDATAAALRCKNGQSFWPEQQCLYEINHFGTLLGCRDGSHLEECGEFDCPPDYAKCPGSYCLALAMVCDGTPDCPNGEDENYCEEYSCKGMFKCRDGSSCVPLSQRCDGKRQCPDEGDDELLCELSCPAHCSCNILTYDCANTNITGVPTDISTLARKIILNNNNLVLFEGQFDHYFDLIELHLASNGIKTLPRFIFLNLRNLQLLDLSKNSILTLNENSFLGLKNLLSLNLEGNPLSEISENAFLDLVSLPGLSLKDLELKELASGTFNGLPSLTTLDISENQLTSLGSGIFSGILNIKNLNMSKNKIAQFEKVDFTDLTSLLQLESDDYMFCCFVDIGEENCLPKPDQFSSCADLMNNNILRIFLWILGVMAFAGNIFVLAWRTIHHEGQKVPNFLLCNLSIADLLMGLYMLSIAFVDTHFRGNYIENAKWWKSSWLCSFLGCLSTVSSEASVLSLSVITFDRLFNIVFPLSTKKLDMRSARMVTGGVWAFSILMGAVPLFPSQYFQGQFYSRSSVCVSIHITSEVSPGWEYSVAIFHGLNFTTFIFIFLAYSYMYDIIKRLETTAGAQQKKREMAAARKMTLIVVTDFCCWVPINVMGVLAMSGVGIPGEIYAWTVVFILPVNSALNPILYSVSAIEMPCFKKGKSGMKGSESKSSILTSQSFAETKSPQNLGINVTMSVKKSDESGLRSLDDILHSDKTKLTNLVYTYTMLYQVAELMNNLHHNDLCLGRIDGSTILLHQNKTSPVVSVKGYPLWSEVFDEGPASDIEMFGRLVSRILKARTVTLKQMNT